ncbi:PIB2 [Candida jiufengensis]|uniref:PIB2 n=1 Tax=Candida jiufengensis TaxID=497108 RepID=UPI002224601B|nr:PIB2 [Candida jiufengensis]KAI5951446.1 PIB2 [Candida jiufengensis]
MIQTSTSVQKNINIKDYNTTNNNNNKNNESNISNNNDKNDKTGQQSHYEQYDKDIIINNKSNNTNLNSHSSLENNNMNSQIEELPQNISNNNNNDSNENDTNTNINANTITNANTNTKNDINTNSNNKINNDNTVEELNGSQQQQPPPPQQQQQLPSPTSSHHSNNSKNSENPNNDEQSGSFNNKSSDIMFAKKDLSKSRTQSYQSVLSIASLKSLKQQHMLTTTTPVNPTLNRNNSATNNPQLLRSNSSMNNFKNFQSFIQAPVLSSITNQKSMEDLQIGQQLPFNDKPDTKKRRNTNKTSSTTSTEEDNNDNNDDDEETLLQQKNLTLNALKKLSLSPRPVTNPDDLVISKIEEQNARRKSKTQEPYQPAEVDLSSFASLTRQPKTTPKIPSPVNQTPTTNLINSQINRKQSLPRLPEGELIDPITHNNNNNNTSSSSSTSSSQNINQYHQDLKQQQLDSFNRQQDIKPQRDQFRQPFQSNNNLPTNSQARIPVMPPQDINTKRKPSNPGLQAVQSLPHMQQSHLQQQNIPQPINSQQQQYQPHQNHQHHHQNQPYQQNEQNQNQRSNKHLQQIKGLRNPMYVPAVLRMTQSGSYYLSNRSGSNSPDFLSSSPEYEAHLQAFGHQRNIDSSTASIKSTDSTISQDSTNSPKFTSLNRFISSRNFDISKAPPTRKHWIKDETVLKCSIPTCTKVFNFFERRHHCRKCGGIFCKEHTSHSLYINHMAQFTTGGRGTLSKVCDNCIAEYNEFIQKEFGVHINPKSPSAIELNHNANIINNNIPHHFPHHKNQQIRQSFKELDKANNQQKPNKSNIINGSNQQNNSNNRSEQLVGSVPANWSWSSF